jgi:hypothetical protein
MFNWDLIKTVKTNPGKWVKLKAKYKKITPSNMQDKEKELILWEKDPDMLIEDAWIVLTDI